jgi:hypothetical protein
MASKSVQVDTYTCGCTNGTMASKVSVQDDYFGSSSIHVCEHAHVHGHVHMYAEDDAHQIL